MNFKNCTQESFKMFMLSWTEIKMAELDNNPTLLTARHHYYISILLLPTAKLVNKVMRKDVLNSSRISTVVVSFQ